MSVIITRTDNVDWPLTAVAEDSGLGMDLTGATLETHVPLEDGSEVVLADGSHVRGNQTTTPGAFTLKVRDLGATVLAQLPVGTFRIRTKATWPDPTPDGTIVNFTGSVVVKSERVTTF